MYLSFHSYGEVIIFPWGYTADACPTYVELLEGGTAIAKVSVDKQNKYLYLFRLDSVLTGTWFVRT